MLHQVTIDGQGIGVAQLATQVQAVLGTGLPGSLAGSDGLDHRRQLLHAPATRVDVADGQRIEHRSDASGDDLRIVGQHRRGRRPIHAWPGALVCFQVIGVQLHQPR